MESMFMNVTYFTFDRLLKSSQFTLKTLILKRRNPFYCSYCKRESLCKWHKCQDCGLRSYCSTECQSEDWWQHQYVCSYHDPNGILEHLYSDNLLNGGYLDTICSFKYLITLDLSWCFMVHHTALKLISLSCVNLQNIILNGCDVSDHGIIALTTNLTNIQTLHCRSARHVTDEAIQSIYNNWHKTLIDIDISRCCLITKDICLNLINYCNKIESLSIACGIKRGGWIWTMDDDLAKAILINLKNLKKLHYIYANNKQLSNQYEQKLFNIENIEIQKLTAQRQTQLTTINGRVSVNVVGESTECECTNPVLMEHIVNGKVVYEKRFRR